MKKLCCICICIMIFLISINTVFADYNDNPRNLKQDDHEAIIRDNLRNAANTLSQLDIVRNPTEKWD